MNTKKQKNQKQINMRNVKKVQKNITIRTPVTSHIAFKRTVHKITFTGEIVKLTEAFVSRPFVVHRRLFMVGVVQWCTYHPVPDVWIIIYLFHLLCTIIQLRIWINAIDLHSSVCNEQLWINWTHSYRIVGLFFRCRIISLNKQIASWNIIAK